jgi:hypothetical protein
MEANELRIGNYVYTGNLVVKSYSADGLYNLTRNIEDDNSKITPIPLTEEWLLNFGLSKNNGYPYKFLNGFIKIRNGFYFYKYYHLDIELKYVHQLQNLYFALTGEELKQL